MGREELIRKLQKLHREIEPGQDVTIGLFRPEDAPGIALTYYEAYGASFPMGYVYDPDEIVRRNGTESQYTMVAKTPRGEVVGLAVLFRPAPNPDVYEAAQLIVLKNYRKRNLGTELGTAMLDILPRRFGIPVVFCETVANHVISQKLNRSEGLVFTGLEVECLPSRAYTGEVSVDSNISLFLMFKAFGKSSCGVHLPEAYREFCDAVYAELALPRVVSPAETLTGDTMASQFFLREIGLMRLTVTRSGVNFGEVVSAAEAEAGGQNMIQVFLNLGDAAAPQAVDVLRGRGYFLAGLLPFWFGSDGLLMQKIRQEPDWDGIQVFGPEATATRAMVRKDFELTNGLP